MATVPLSAGLFLTWLLRMISVLPVISNSSDQRRMQNYLGDEPAVEMVFGGDLERPAERIEVVEELEVEPATAASNDVATILLGAESDSSSSSGSDADDSDRLPSNWLDFTDEYLLSLRSPEDFKTAVEILIAEERRLIKVKDRQSITKEECMAVDARSLAWIVMRDELLMRLVLRIERLEAEMEQGRRIKIKLKTPTQRKKSELRGEINELKAKLSEWWPLLSQHICVRVIDIIEEDLQVGRFPLSLSLAKRLVTADDVEMLSWRERTRKILRMAEHLEQRLDDSGCVGCWQILREKLKRLVMTKWTDVFAGLSGGNRNGDESMIQRESLISGIDDEGFRIFRRGDAGNAGNEEFKEARQLSDYADLPPLIDAVNQGILDFFTGNWSCMLWHELAIWFDFAIEAEFLPIVRLIVSEIVYHVDELDFEHRKLGKKSDLKNCIESLRNDWDCLKRPSRLMRLLKWRKEGLILFPDELVWILLVKGEEGRVEIEVPFISLDELFVDPESDQIIVNKCMNELLQVVKSRNERRKLRVHFDDQIGFDQGGPRRYFLEMLNSLLSSPNLPFLIRSDDEDGGFLINPLLDWRDCGQVYRILAILIYRMIEGEGEVSARWTWNQKFLKFLTGDVTVDVEELYGAVLFRKIDILLDEKVCREAEVDPVDYFNESDFPLVTLLLGRSEATTLADIQEYRQGLVAHVRQKLMTGRGIFTRELSKLMGLELIGSDELFELLSRRLRPRLVDSVDQVIGRLIFPEIDALVDELEEQVKSELKRLKAVFVEMMRRFDQRELEEFLVFATGTRTLQQHS